MNAFVALCAASLTLVASTAIASPILTTFEAAGADAAAITATRDAFRAAIGGGTVAGPGGSFGGARREINWDGVPDAFADPNALPADFFNVNSPRGVELSTPGTGFLVSANAGTAVPTLFGFASDLQAFSPQRLFTAINSPVTDVLFFVPGTHESATTTAFGVIFTGVETAGSTRLDFFDENGLLFHSRNVLVAGDGGLSFSGATVSGGAIGRVRITSGANTIVANGVTGRLFDDLVAMDDWIYAEPHAARNVPEPSTLALFGLALMSLLAYRSASPQRRMWIAHIACALARAYRTIR